MIELTPLKGQFEPQFRNFPIGAPPLSVKNRIMQFLNIPLSPNEDTIRPSDSSSRVTISAKRKKSFIIMIELDHKKN